MAEEQEVNMRRETLTPPSSVESDHPGLLENGYQGQNSDESGSEMNCDEAPLDFSVRKRSDSIDDLGSDGNEEFHSRNSESGSQSAGESSTTSAGTETPPQNLGNGTKGQPLSPSVKTLNGLKPEDVAGKICEPQLALPFGVPGAVFPGLNAFPPGFNAAATAAAGILPNATGMLGALPFSQGMVDNRKLQNSSKPTRPFKAYPKDPLSLPLGYYGIPGMLPGITLPNFDPAVAQSVNANTEDLFNQYRMLLKSQEKNGKASSLKVGKNGVIDNNSDSETKNGNDGNDRILESPVSPVSTTGSNASLSPQPSTVLSQSSVSTSPPNPSPLQQPPGPFTSPSAVAVETDTLKYQLNASTSTPRKKAKLLPDDKKDAAYWERRRKNNDAAKRSRDARRAKEDEIAIRAAFLEQENLKLRVEVAALKNETAKLRCMLYNS